MPSPPLPMLCRCLDALRPDRSAYAWLPAPELTTLGFSLRTTFGSRHRLLDGTRPTTMGSDDGLVERTLDTLLQIEKQQLVQVVSG
ncbi:MAG: hypothetical protein ABF876_09210 [Acetobacter aceti]|uniref:hypothetical protein n=1 Tax=Acetobacter aceti TaxID=435 RepID=UPI001656FA0B|nr:hypothetical protein [Acetobacter aceti]